jgi:uncharacterized membrane protein YebE (DUF533 family)
VKTTTIFGLLALAGLAYYAYRYWLWTKRLP